MKGRTRAVRHRRTMKRQLASRRKKPGRRRPNGSAAKGPGLNLNAIWKSGYQAGLDAPENRAMTAEHARHSWREHWQSISGNTGSYEAAMQAGKAYMQGYVHAAGYPVDIVPVPLHHSAAAVVCACNEERTLGKVMAQLKRLPLKDIIVVLNGTTDDSLNLVLAESGITLVYEPDRAGHDVGRALGAKMTEAEAILFVDGDMVLPAEQLAPFLYAVDRGSDVALNNLSSLLPPFARQDEVSRIKAYLNRTLGRPDLESNSLTAVPHALSRKMIQTVKPESLAVPPKAQAMAIRHGLNVTAPCQVDVIRSNRLRTTNTGSGNEVAGLIIGDHLEAIATWMAGAGHEADSRTLSRTEVAYRRNVR
ncbi:glycosyltransferase family A protein [Paenibacillus sp. MABNR03]|uniref:glycosyltransferase family A protein n=1 Tax=Paenibacillus sp. MABNR03 TaxID=3142626 RepID=UPI003D2746E7